MSNIADFILEQYYSKVYPAPLGRQRVTVPGTYPEYEGNYTLKQLAKRVLFSSSNDSDELIKLLEKEATKGFKKEFKKEQSSINNFPLANDGENLSMYALRLYNNTHALDKGTEKRRKLDIFLKETFGKDDLSFLNISINKISSTVWSKGVTINYGFCGTSLEDIYDIPLKDLKTVWIFENNNTASRIIQSGLEFPFIITGGRPTEACHILLERLVEAGVKLLYQGDIDKAGIDMADLLKAKYPELETPFMTTTVFDKHALLSKGKEQNYLLKKTKSVGLKAMIEQTGKAVYEEQLDLQEHYLYWVAENSLAQKNVDY